MLENIIIKNFLKVNKNYNKNNVIICLNDDNISCEIMEKRDNGKVWYIEYTKSGKIKNICEL